jgi:hypothetical protein
MFLTGLKFFFRRVLLEASSGASGELRYATSKT